MFHWDKAKTQVNDKRERDKRLSTRPDGRCKEKERKKNFMQSNCPSSPPGVNFINVLRAHFSYKFLASSWNVTRKAAIKDVRTKKAREKMLMKLTPGSSVYLYFFFYFRVTLWLLSFFKFIIIFQVHICSLSSFLSLRTLALYLSISTVYPGNANSFIKVRGRITYRQPPKKLA